MCVVSACVSGYEWFDVQPSGWNRLNFGLVERLATRAHGIRLLNIKQGSYGEKTEFLKLRKFGERKL